MGNFEILETTRLEGQTEEDVREALKSVRPNSKVENIVWNEKNWVIRLADTPDFLKKKDEDDSSDESSGDEESDSSDEPTDESDNSDHPDNKDKEKSGDPVEKIKGLLKELEGVVGELAGHKDKVDDIHKIVDPEGAGADVPITDGPPEDIGPTPQPMPGGGMGGGMGGPRGPMAPRRPRPGMTPPGRPSTFTKRKTEVAHHSGLDDEGNLLSLTEVGKALEADPEFEEYIVEAIKKDGDSYIAKLVLKG